MAKKTELWRMKTAEHICPYGLKSKDLLKRKGIDVEDHTLTSKEESKNFKKKHDVKTTPQTFIDGERIGGYDALRQYFGLKKIEDTGTKYDPVIAIFITSFLTAAALVWNVTGTFLTTQLVLWFVAIAMIILAVQKLKDLNAFSMQFITYDLLAMRWIPYSYIYPFAEAYAGIGMLAKLPTFLVAPVGIAIGSLGAVSVIKAVYIDKRDIKCACVGGNSKVPLGFISLTENLFMVGAGIWMLCHL